jgi:hypothetical protein
LEAFSTGEIHVRMTCRLRRAGRQPRPRAVSESTGNPANELVGRVGRDTLRCNLTSSPLRQKPKPCSVSHLVGIVVSRKAPDGRRLRVLAAAKPNNGPSMPSSTKTLHDSRGRTDNVQILLGAGSVKLAGISSWPTAVEILFLRGFPTTTRPSAPSVM